jgi:hypothetical protein
MAEEILSKHLVSGLRWYDVRLGADVSFHQIRPGYRVLCSFKKTRAGICSLVERAKLIKL